MSAPSTSLSDPDTWDRTLIERALHDLPKPSLEGKTTVQDAMHAWMESFYRVATYYTGVQVSPSDTTETLQRRMKERRERMTSHEFNVFYRRWTGYKMPEPRKRPSAGK